jgi:hypothetical protein
MSTLDDWIADACHALELPADAITPDLRDQLLELTKDVAHGVTRVAGPLTTYLAGIAVGSGTPPSAALRRLAELAAGMADQESDDEA